MGLVLEPEHAQKLGQKLGQQLKQEWWALEEEGLLVSETDAGTGTGR